MMTDETDLKLWIALSLSNEKFELFPNLADITPELVKKLILREGVAPLLSYHIRGTKAGNLVPEYLLAFLENIERKAIARELYRKGLNRRFFEKLNTAGIDFLVLKGEAVAHQLYPQSYLRTRCDADVLFRDRESAISAWKILEKEGYKKANTLDGEFVGYQFNCYKNIGSAFSNEIDIHHKINDYIWLADRLPFDELYAKNVNFKIDDIELRTTGLVHSLLHACIHRVNNKVLGKENRLIWVYDIHLLCNEISSEQWHKLAEKAKKKNLAFIVYEALTTSKDLFYTRIPETVLLILKEAANKECSPFGRTGKRWKLYYFDFVENKGILNKAKQIREHLIPNPDYIKQKYPGAGSWNLPYYYLKRLLSGLGKYF